MAKKQKPKKQEPKKQEAKEKPKKKPLGLKVSVAVFGIIGILLLINGIFGLFTAETTVDTLVDAIRSDEYSEQLQAEGLEESLSELQGMSDAELRAMLMESLTFMLWIILVLGIVYVITAYFLWMQNKIAKYVASVLCLLGALYFPLGTIIHGVVLYFLWFDEDTKAVFAK